RARARNPRILVLSSVRDVLVEKADAQDRDRATAALVRSIFDRVWVHSDPALLPFERTFTATDLIRDRLAYTGFVGEAAPEPQGAREKKILVSLGGGRTGEELLGAAARVMPHFPDHRFHFLTGPYAPAGTAARLEAALGPAESAR